MMLAYILSFIVIAVMVNIEYGEWPNTEGIL